MKVAIFRTFGHGSSCSQGVQHLRHQCTETWSVVTQR